MAGIDTKSDAIYELVEEGSEVEKLATGFTFTEGPIWHPTEHHLLFSDMPGDVRRKYTPDGGVVEVLRPSFKCNGLTYDADLNLLVCEHVTSSLVRERPNGVRETVAYHWQGKYLNSPNDLVIDNAGRIYFTDPRYGDQTDRELNHESIYRIDPDGKVSRVLSQPDIQKPNGVTISPDNRTLYVVDSNPAPGGNRKIWAFDIAGDLSLSGGRVVYDFAPGRGGDGMRTDANGNLWIAAGVYRARNPNETTDVPTGVYVVTPKGEMLGRIPIPEDAITNLAFGGPDLKTLYIVAGKTLFSVRVNVAGHVVYPKPRT